MKRAIFAAAVAAGLAVPAGAAANGPCGQNYDGNHACPINSPASESGSITTDNEGDYYVFHALAGTQLYVSITDTENPSCSTANYPINCGSVQVELDDAQGNSIESTDSSAPNNNITVPRNLSHSMDRGNYFLKVTGSFGRDVNGNPSVVPYTLNVSASPNVSWPPPPPYHVRQCHHRYVRKRVGRGHHRHWVRVKVTTCRTVTIYP